MSITVTSKAGIPAFTLRNALCTECNRKPKTLLRTSPNRAIISFIGKRICESRLPRKDDTMNPIIRARNYVHQIQSAIAGPTCIPEERAGIHGQADGRIGLARRRPTLAQVHQPDQSSADVRPNALRDDGAVRVGPGNDGSHLGKDACSRRGDRDRIIGNAADNAALAHHLLSPPIIISIAAEALRAATMAPSTSEALDIVGGALLRITYLAQSAEVSHG